MAETRSEMADDVDALRARAAERVHAVTRRLDVAQLIREHPWPALGAAVALGAIIAGSGADEAAAAATVKAAKNASRATADAAKRTVEKVRRHQSGDENASEQFQGGPERPGMLDRLFEGVGLSLAGGLDRILDEMRAASRQWGARMARSDIPQPVSARAPRPVTPAATDAATTVAIITAHELAVARPSPEAVAAEVAPVTVPVPDEIAPAELGLRADAVEAVGGGTHEPPLEEGAGELGARWS